MIDDVASPMLSSAVPGTSGAEGTGESAGECHSAKAAGEFRRKDKNQVGLKRRFKRAPLYVQVSANIVIIAGIIAFFLQAHWDNVRERKQNAVSLVRDYQAQNQLQNRRVLLRPWMTKEAAELFAGRASDRALADFLRASLAQMTESQRDDMLHAVAETVDFYDNVLLCRSSTLCDAGVLDAYFGLYAERFVCLYLPMIQDIRRDSQSDDFAHRLTSYVERRGGCAAGDAFSPPGEG